MNQVDGVSNMVLPLCVSMWGMAQKRDNSRCLAFGVLCRRKLSPSTHPDARHFSFSPHATGASSATATVLEPRGSESA